jgi:hypothetical protein
MAGLKLDEEHQWSGEWHLPDQPNHKIAGLLKWDGGATLELNDAFDELKSGPIFANSSEQHAAIHGLTTKGQLVTVIQSGKASQQINFASGGLRRPTKYRATWLVVGLHGSNETLYTSCRFVVPGLELWLCQPWHKMNYQTGHCLISLDSPDPIKVTLGDTDCELEIATLVTASTLPPSQVVGEAKGVVTIRSKSGRPLEWHLAQYGKFIDLVSIVGGTPFAPVSIEAICQESGSRVEVLVALGQPKQCKFKHHHEFYMLGTEVGMSLDSLIFHWFEAYERVQMPLRLVLSALASNDLWIHMEFLTYMQCLEGFHRALYVGNYMDTDAFEKAADIIIAAIPKDLSSSHRKSLKSRIGYGNEISLAKRLKELCNPLSPELRVLILGKDGKVPQRWVDTRDYYTHWDAASKHKILSYLEMHQTSLRLKQWLRALYLLHIGIPADCIFRSAQGAHGDSQYLLQLNGAESYGHIQISDPAD